MSCTCPKGNLGCSLVKCLVHNDAKNSKNVSVSIAVTLRACKTLRQLK